MKKTIIWIIGLVLFYGALNAQTSGNIKLEIYQIKVRVGHATLIVARHKEIRTTIYKSILIDAGNSGSDADNIAQVIIDKAAGRLDAVFVTHHDQDHWGGLTMSQNTKALLRRRCIAGQDLYSPNMLNLYFNHTVAGTPPIDNDPTGLNMWNINKINEVAKNNINIINWNNSTADIPLVTTPSGTSLVQLKTLAANGYLKGENNANQRALVWDSEIGTDGKKHAHFKNNASAVALITWDDFSFLIQGDLEAAFAGTTYNHQHRNVNVNTQGTEYHVKYTTEKGRGIKPSTIVSPTDDWDNISAKTNLFYETDDVRNELDDKSNSYTIRMEELRGSSEIFLGFDPLSSSRKRIRRVLTQFNEQIVTAAPNAWFHRLGKQINDQNGAGAYAHACMALVPHHGAKTSNLWFDTDLAIIGSNRYNTHSHPRKEALIALYNTARPRHAYVTYLLNRGDKTMNDDIYEAYTNGVLPTNGTFRLFYLDGKGKSNTSTHRTNPYMKGPIGNETTNGFFKFTIRQVTGGSKKEIHVESDNPNLSRASGLGNWSTCSRGH